MLISRPIVRQTGRKAVWVDERLNCIVRSVEWTEACDWCCHQLFRAGPSDRHQICVGKRTDCKAAHTPYTCSACSGNTWKWENLHPLPSSTSNPLLPQHSFVNIAFFLFLYIQMLHLQCSVWLFCFCACYEFSFRRFSLHHHGEDGETDREGEQEGGREDQRALAQTNCTSELTFLLFFPLPFCLFCPSPRPPRRFSPRCWSWIMGTLWRLPAPWVYSAQLEWRLVSYTTTHTHPSFPPSKPVLFSKSLTVPASTLSWGRLGPLSLVVPPPVKLRDTDEHWGASYRFLYLQQWGCGAPIGLWPQGQNELTAPQGTETSSSMLCEQLCVHSVFRSQQLCMDKVLIFLPIVFSSATTVQILFVILMHIKIFSGVIYLHSHSGSKLVALLEGLF